MRALILVISCSTLIVLGQILWKIAIDSNGGLLNSKYSILQNVYNLAASPYMLIGILIYMFATIFWMYLLGEYEYSFIYPLFSFTYILSIIFGSVLFNEVITIYKIIGISFIIAGIIIIFKTN